MDVLMLSERGVPLMCETEGCGQRATSAWSGTYGPPKRSCDKHNPYSNAAMPLPVNFASQPLCHACGQPVRMGAAAGHLPGHRWMATAGEQIRWALDYIRGRYGGRDDVPGNEPPGDYDGLRPP